MITPLHDELRLARLQVFYEIREIPYARGECAAKVALLAERFESLGYRTRTVKGRYFVADWPEEVRLVPNRVDIHYALEIEIEGQWILVDWLGESARMAGFWRRTS
ncbi:MAG: hypothetical protein ABIR96_07345, partial [Bdellovibrionota bacterium]